MTRSQRKQLSKWFRPHLHPVKTFRGDPKRPAYTLYSWWNYPTYLAAQNELDELVAQWPRNWQRTVALLAVGQAFRENGATHWDEELIKTESQTNIHAYMLHERQQAQWIDPALAAQHARNFALAEAALVESQRRKQGAPTGNAPRRSARVRRLKTLVFAPATPQLALHI